MIARVYSPAPSITSCYHCIYPIPRRNLRNFGMDLDEGSLRKFFNHFDRDGSGVIDFYEFVDIVLPNDYPASTTKLNGSSKLWDSLPENGERIRSESLRNISKLMHGVPNNKGWSPFCDDVPESIRSFKWTNEYVETLLRNKICERGAASKDLLQQAYFLFGRPGKGLTQKAFGQVLKQKLGLPVSQEQCAELFRKYDTSGDGMIDFYEFVEVKTKPHFYVFFFSPPTLIMNPGCLSLENHAKGLP